MQQGWLAGLGELQAQNRNRRYLQRKAALRPGSQKREHMENQPTKSTTLYTASYGSLSTATTLSHSFLLQLAIKNFSISQNFRSLLQWNVKYIKTMNRKIRKSQTFSKGSENIKKIQRRKKKLATRSMPRSYHLASIIVAADKRLSCESLLMQDKASL